MMMKKRFCCADLSQLQLLCLLFLGLCNRNLSVISRLMQPSMSHV